MRPAGAESLAYAAALACAAALLATEAFAQDYTTGPEGRFLDPAARAASDPFAECSTELSSADAAELACDVMEALDLQTPVEAWLLRYRRSAEVPEGGATAVVEVEEFALIEAAGGGYEVVWRLPVDLRFERLGTGAIAQLGPATVIAYQVCAQGAGGCDEQYLMRDRGWTVLAQPFLDRLAELAPEGWTLDRGRRVDLGSLTGVQPLTGPEDADGNCCASGSIRFSLALEGDALVLADATVDVPEPEPPPDSTAATPEGGDRPSGPR